LFNLYKDVFVKKTSHRIGNSPFLGKIFSVFDILPKDAKYYRDAEKQKDLKGNALGNCPAKLHIYYFPQSSFLFFFHFSTSIKVNNDYNNYTLCQVFNNLLLKSEILLMMYLNYQINRSAVILVAGN